MKIQMNDIDWFQPLTDNKQPRRERKKTWIPTLLVVVILIFILCWMTGLSKSRTLVFSETSIFSEKIRSSFSFLVISDLHSDSFGDHNSDLLNQIKEKANSSAFITLAGDMIDDQSTNPEEFLLFCHNLVKILPVYFSPGNSELEREDWLKLKKRLIDLGVNVLDKSYEELNIRGNQLIIGGLYDYSFALNGDATVEEEKMDPDTVSFLQKMKEADGFKLMVSHRPDSFYFNRSGNYWNLDLVVSGHTHGGQIVLPDGSGLWSPDQGWLPEVDRGLYWLEDLPILVSAGLSSGNSMIPRWNNPGMIEVVNILPFKSNDQ